MLDRSQFSTRKILTDELVVVFNKHNPLAHRQGVITHSARRVCPFHTQKGRESVCPRGPIPLAETMGMPDLPITSASDEVRPLGL